MHSNVAVDEAADARAFMDGFHATDAEKARLRDLVATVVDVRAQITALETREARAFADAAAIAERQVMRTGSSRKDAEIPARAVAAELAAALRVNSRTVQGRMHDAADLVARFPGTMGAWETGDITRRHAVVIQEAGRYLDDVDAREAFERMAVRAAIVETPGRLGPIVKILAAKFDTHGAVHRHRLARRGRRVVAFDLPDDMAELTLTHSAVVIRGIHDRATSLAKAVIRARRGQDADPNEDAEPDTRCLDEVRADILAEMLLCSTPDVGGAGIGDALDAIHATVRITVPVLTLAGAAPGAVEADPAVLEGYGPIDLDEARHLTEASPVWERVMTSPVTGTVLAVDRYHPSADMIRYLAARDERCRFPGCRMPARRCDRDHTIDHARGGPTCLCNLVHLCEGHHTLKHHSDWTVRQLGGGLLEWTSPLGAVYTDRPEATLRFVPADDELPGMNPLPGDPDAPPLPWPPPPGNCTHPTSRTPDGWTPRDPRSEPG